MSLNGKQLHDMIARRKERQAEVKREAQGTLFSTREQYLEDLAERARATLVHGIPIEELDAEIAASRKRRQGRGKIA